MDDNQFLEAMGISPCYSHPIPHDWTERDILTATATPDELRAEREMNNRRAELIGNLKRTVELMEAQERQLRRIISQWKSLAWSALLMAAAFLTAAIVLAKGLSR